MGLLPKMGVCYCGVMAVSGVMRRRLVGTGALGGALLMLVLGQTVLLGPLQGLAFLLYWLACLALTSLAIAVALLDARATRLELRRRNRELLEQTVKEIQQEADARKNRRSQGQR